MLCADVAAGECNQRVEAMYKLFAVLSVLITHSLTNLHSLPYKLSDCRSPCR